MTERVLEALNKSPLKMLGLTFAQIADEIISRHYKGDKEQEKAIRIEIAKAIQSLIEARVLVMQRDWRVTFNADIPKIPDTIHDSNG